MAQTFRKTEDGYLEVTTTQEGQDDIVIKYTRPEVASRLETVNIIQIPEIQATLNGFLADKTQWELYVQKCDELGVTTNF